MTTIDRLVFRDRADAGRHLGEQFKGRTLRKPLVLAIPRGGVVTGVALARALDAELDVILSRKLRAQYQPELAIGAISEDGQVTLNPWAMTYASEAYLAEECRRQTAEIKRRAKLLRAVRPAAPIAGRSVIVTDDGLATGSTMIAALQAVRGQRPHELIAAVPVAAPERVEPVRQLCDDFVCLLMPENFYAVAQFYDDFDTVEDDDVVHLLREAWKATDPSREVAIQVGPQTLQGTLEWIGEPQGVIVFAHGSGSSRFSPRNRYVASVLNQAGYATLLLDLLTEREAEERSNVFDVELLASRLAAAANWVRGERALAGLPIGLFGASTGSAAALIAAAAHPTLIDAVVSRGGRRDLAWDVLPNVQAPTLLIVGGDDELVLGLNRDALDRLRCVKELEVIPGATHLFEEPGALERVADLARDWFGRHLTAAAPGELEPAGQS